MTVLALPFPVIDPIAFAIGPVAIRWYGIAYVIGFLGGWWYARRLAADVGLWGDTKRPSALDIDDMLMWVVIGVILGGRLGHVLFYEPGRYLAAPADILKVWQGGMSFHGGLIGSIIGIVLFARRRGLVALSLLDIAATVVPIGIFLGRIANFINAELWGRQAPDVPWAIVFPQAGPVPRHPSQLYEAATEGVVLFVVLAIAVRVFGFRRPGRVGAVFFIGYALSRILCEFFREPDAQIGYLAGGWLTMGMVLSLPMLVVGLLVFALLSRRREDLAA